MSQRMSVVELMNMKSNQPNITMSISEHDFQPITKSDDNDDFLADLSNDKFVSKKEVELSDKERKKRDKEQEQYDKKQARLFRKQEADEKRAEKLKVKQEKQALKEAVLDDKPSYNSSLFVDSEGTQILGREKLELIAKINQYKLLFPDNKQIQHLKIKKGATIDELVLYLAECDAYISTSTVDKFVTDAILQTIKIGELVSCQTRYNLTGLSDMLKKNLQFNSLCRQLYLKYKVFSNIPPENQLALIVVTSAWVCVQANKNQSVPINLDKQIDPALF